MPVTGCQVISLSLSLSLSHSTGVLPQSETAACRILGIWKRIFLSLHTSSTTDFFYDFLEIVEVMCKTAQEQAVYAVGNLCESSWTGTAAIDDSC